jgi:hypothetical protein
VKNFLQLLAQAVSIVKKDIPSAKFCEADGTPSKGTAQQESDVDTWLFRFMVPPTKSASIEYEHGSFQLPVLTFQPILGDRIIPLPLKMGLKEAIKLKDAAGYKSPFSPSIYFVKARGTCSWGSTLATSLPRKPKRKETDPLSAVRLGRLLALPVFQQSAQADEARGASTSGGGWVNYFGGSTTY